jgi:hypothetical protein
MNSKLKQNRGRTPRNRSADLHAPGRVPDRATTRIEKITRRPPRGSDPSAKIAQKKGGPGWRCRDAGSVYRGRAPSRPVGRRRVGKIAPRRANGIAVPGNFAHPTGAAFAGTIRGRRKSGSSSGQADSWSRRSRMTLKRNLIQTVRSKRRGVSGPARLSGQCYTVVTPCAGVAGVIAVTHREHTRPRRIKHGVATPACGKRLFHTLFSMFFRFVPHCEGFAAQASNCQFVHSRPYQIEMLLPHCRHDFLESCHARAPFESSKLSPSSRLVRSCLVMLGS